MAIGPGSILFIFLTFSEWILYTDKEVGRVEEPEDRERLCEMLSLRQDMLIAFMNSLKLWLPAQTQVNIPTGSTNGTQWVTSQKRRERCVCVLEGRRGKELGTHDQDALLTCEKLPNME